MSAEPDSTNDPDSEQDLGGDIFAPHATEQPVEPLGAPERAPRRAGGYRHRRRVPRILRRAVVSAIAFTALLAVSSTSIAGAFYRHYNGQIKHVSALKTSDANIVEPAKQLKADNFLLIGSDTRVGVDQSYGSDVEGARSDTTILVHLSPDRAKATVISFPRDSWVQIPACSDGKGGTIKAHQDLLNSAFTFGGAACTVALLQSLTGIQITHYVQIDFSGFKNMVNALGTVTICSPSKVVDGGSGLRLVAGNNQLDGDQALAYVRARESIGDGSDLGRIKRQQLFLGAVLRQAMSGHLLTDPSRLTSFLDAATKSITVDNTSLSDLRTLATSMQGLDPAHVTFYTAPIANRDYSPPGTTMSGKVLLDPVAGKTLYSSIIDDQSLVVPATTVAAAPTGEIPTPVVPTPSATSTVPAGASAADQTCSL